MREIKKQKGCVSRFQLKEIGENIQVYKLVFSTSNKKM